MTTASRWSLLAIICLVCASVVSAANDTNVTGTIDTTAVQLSNETAFAVCLYPSSGSYSFLNRLLYYCTLVFSLFSRAHLWLVAGALATALLYSGAAAVHACLLAWRGPNPYEEMDVFPLITILSTACLITVPLLSWSGTLRRLGARFADTKDSKALETQRHAGTRTIVIYWAFLVLVGYVSAWKAIWYSDTDEVYPDMGKVFCRPGTNASVFFSNDGSFHKRAVDQDFVTLNKCNNPCDLLTIPSIFRQNNDLVLLNYKQALLYTSSLKGAKYRKVNNTVNVEGVFDTINQLILPFILLQGFISVCFGRRGPREIRDLIYIKLALDRPISKNPVLLAIQDWMARIVACLSYLMAVLMVIICPPLFIMIVIEQEWSSTYQDPDSEPVTSVGQWGPWAIAVQAIIAALISRYHDRVIEFIADMCRAAYKKCGGRSNQQVYQDVHEQKQQTPSAIDTPDLESATKTKDETKANVLPLSKTALPMKVESPKPKQPWSRHIVSLIVDTYKACASPLNQNGKGLWDELKNFFHWCGDPRRVSRRVVRHPIRVTDEQVVENDDDTESTQGSSIGVPQTRRESGFFRAASVRMPAERP